MWIKYPAALFGNILSFAMKFIVISAFLACLFNNLPMCAKYLPSFPPEDKEAADPVRDPQPLKILIS